MDDPILDEIWRVRAEMVKEHGGLQGYLRYIMKLDRAYRRRKQRRKAGNVKKTPRRSRKRAG
jgi:hypothetical protein